MSTEPQAIQTTTIPIDETQISELAAKSSDLLRQAQEFTIEDEDDYAGSLSLIEIAIERENRIASFFAEPTSLAFKLHRSLTSRVAFLRGPYVAVQTLMKSKRQDYRSKMEAERRRIEDAQRAEAKRQQDEAAMREAEELAAQGEHAAAEKVIEQAAAAPPPPVVVQSFVSRQTGSTVKQVWDFRIDDPDKVPNAYKVIDESKIRKVITALHDKHGIPGVTAFPKDQESIRRKA